MTTYHIPDWQDPEYREEGAPDTITLDVQDAVDGLMIAAGDRMIKIELQNGALRVLAYDENISESPAILTLHPDGKGPIEADLSDHLANRFDAEDMTP